MRAVQLVQVLRSQIQPDARPSAKLKQLDISAMKSAISIIASSGSDPTRAIVALLEVAMDALDAAGHLLPAAYVDLALNAYLEQELGAEEPTLGGHGTVQ
jgi:hypothetical protein